MNAVTGKADAAGATPVALLTFELDGNRFGILVEAVREICQSVTIAPLPRAPAAIEGVLDVRGTLMPVFDMRSRLGLPPRAQGLGDHLVIAHAGARIVAVRVDRAIDLVSVPASQIQAAGELDAGLRHVAGVARLPDGLVVIADLTTFLSPAEADQLAAALEAT